MANRRGGLLVLAGAGLLTLIVGGVGMTGRATGSSIGCHIKNGAIEDGVMPVRAFCEWPVPPDRLNAMLSAYGTHDEVFSLLAESSVLSTRGEVVRVRQIHSVSGISDREVVVDWTAEQTAKGKQYRWERSADQAETSGRNIIVPVHRGHWEVRPSGSCSELIYNAQYLPGGTVPPFLVRWFQGAGTEKVLKEFRQAAEGA